MGNTETQLQQLALVENYQYNSSLILSMQGPDYCMQIKPIPGILMAWPLALPGTVKPLI